MVETEMVNVLFKRDEEILQDVYGVHKDIAYFENGVVFYPFCNKKFKQKNQDYPNPEERVRMIYVKELILKYKYPKDKIDIEVLVPRRTPEDRADIVVFSDEEHKKPFIVVEVKEEKISESDKLQAIEQAFGNANNLDSDFVVFTCGIESAYFKKRGYAPLERKDNRVADIPVMYGKEPKYKFKKGDSQWDIKTKDFSELKAIFSKCHDIIWAGGEEDPSDAFDEMSKIILIKMHDEEKTKKDQEYGFQIGTHESVDVVSERIKKLYLSLLDELKKKNVALDTQALRLNGEKIFNLVNALQEVNIRKSEIDAKGRAFEEFLDAVFRKVAGQYFTPRDVIKFMVEMIDPSDEDLVLDPACGSGGFLLHTREHVKKNLIKDYGEEEGFEKLKSFSLNNIYGIEKSEKIIKVVMVDMILNNIDQPHIRRDNSLVSFELLDGSEFEENKFDIILTNPPFGAVENSKAILRNFSLGKNGEKIKNQQITEILFIERCFQFLKSGTGRLAIVLPDGILTNATLKYVRDFLEANFEIKAMVSIPNHAFTKAGAGVKSSLLFLRKKSEEEILEYHSKRLKLVREYEDKAKEVKKKKLDEKEEKREIRDLIEERDIKIAKIDNYNIFIAETDKIGYDATGRKDKNELMNYEDLNDLSTILGQFKKFGGWKC